MKLLKKMGTALLALFMLAGPAVVKAADFDIVCNDSGCGGLDGPVFTETGMLPGDSASGSISIENNSDDVLEITMELIKNEDTDDDFADIVESMIHVDADQIYNGYLSGTLGVLYDLGSLSIGDSINISYDLHFPSDAGNDFMNDAADFDIRFVITGESSGETEVITTNTSGDPNGTDGNEGEVLGDTTDDSSLMGQLLGLSDTGSLKKYDVLVILGIVLVSLGVYLICSYSYSKLVAGRR